MVDKNIKVSDEIEVEYFVTDARTKKIKGRVARIMDKAYVIECPHQCIIYYDDIVEITVIGNA
jgi:hypothetical protein